MITEESGEYRIESRQEKKYNGRFAVKVQISRKTEKGIQSAEFSAEDKIWYILEIEAAKEAINLGKNLIAKNLTGF